MYDLAIARESFARLAAALGATPAGDALAHLGPTPTWIPEIWSPELIARANGELSSGMPRRPLILADVRSACLAIPPARWLSRGDWREWAASLAWAAVEYPEHADGLRAAMHEASSRHGAWDYRNAFAGGYNRAANDAEWAAMIADTERRLFQGLDVRTLGSLFHEARAHGWSPGDARQPAVTNYPVPMLGSPFGEAPSAQAMSDSSAVALAATVPVSIETSRLSNLMCDTAYKRRFELGDWLVIGEITVINSPGAGGKTTLLVLMALSIGSGSNLLELEVYKARTVLLLNYEETVAELTLKFRAAATHHKVDPAALGRIHIFGSDSVGAAALTIINPATRQAVVNPAWLAEFRSNIVATGAEVVFLDPYSALMPYGMNDNGLTYSVVRALKDIAAEHHCAIVIAHHTRKGGTLDGDGAEATMGAAALTNGARVVLGFRRVDEATAKAIGADYGEEGDYREVINQKANFTPVGKGKYFKLIGVPMHNAAPPYTRGDVVAVAEPYTPRIGSRSLPLAAMRDAAVQLARGAAGGAEPYCQKKVTGGRWFGDDLAAAIKPHMPNLNQRALEAAAKELVAEGLGKGWLIVTTYKNIHRKTAAGLTVVWTATEWAHEPAPAGAYLK